MLTYTKTTQAPRLIIRYDNSPTSPREDDNIGHFIIKHRKHISPDGTDNAYYSAMIGTMDDATSTQHHIELMHAALNEAGSPCEAIYPVNLYEHGDVRFSLGEAHGFDTSTCGFYFVPNGAMDREHLSSEHIKEQIQSELATYTQYANGEVYRFTSYDEEGYVDDQVSGFYDIDDIKDYLSDEWANENMRDYLIYD